MAKFQPGHSGNPKGRPQHAGRAAHLRGLLAPQAPALIGKAVELALPRDTTALRLSLERLIIEALEQQHGTV